MPIFKMALIKSSHVAQCLANCVCVWKPGGGKWGGGKCTKREKKDDMNMFSLTL